MILGITGTNGAGKGSVVNYLVDNKGFIHFSVRERIIDEVKRRGLELNRTNIGETGTSLRREHGANYFTDTFITIAREQGAENIVIESIRTLAEAAYLREQGGKVIAVDAPVEVRYERVTSRGSVTDNVSFEDFRFQEDAEYRPKDISDSTQMNVLGVIETADHVIINDGSLEELHTQIDAVLASRI